MGGRMKILICDDEKGTCSELEELLVQYQAVKGAEFQIDIFYSGEKLLPYLAREGCPDLLLLDIALPGLNGVEVGKWIRQELMNEQTMIVYISSRSSYAMELFQNRPFQFLIKPIGREKLFALMDEILKVRGRDMRCLEFQHKGKSYRIPYGKILYLQSDRRKLSVVTLEGTYEFYGKLEEMEEKLPANQFLKIHKSYLVSTNYIKESSYEQVTMIDGSVLTISQAHRKAVRKKLLENERK